MATLVRVCVAAMIGMACQSRVHAQGQRGDDALRYFASKSTLIVVGQILEGPGGGTSEAGVANYSMGVHVTAVLKGQLPKPSPRQSELPGLDAIKPKQRREDLLCVGIERYELSPTDRLPYFRNGAAVILFLREEERLGVKTWREADPWFAVQPYNQVMERSLERLAQEGAD